MSSIQKSPIELERDYRLALENHDYYSKIRFAIIQKAVPTIILKPEGFLEYKYPEIVENYFNFITNKKKFLLKVYHEENNVQ